VFTLGDENCSPYRFNPFEVFEKISFEKHISNLEACFRGALPLDGPLPFLLSEALEAVYSDRGWSYIQVATGEEDRWPTMKDLYRKLVEVINAKGYSGDVLSNVKTALEVRVGGLLRRSVGRMLNTPFCISPETIMSKPVVFELDPLNDEQQALMTMFILNMIKEYVRANRRSGTGLKHLILMEEAHNLLGHVSPSQETGNPKAEAVKYFTKMLAEMRALGEGIIIADQLPSALHSAVIKNTNLKVMHRLTSEDDRKQLGATMLLDQEQFTKAVTLTPGESYVYMEGLERPKHIFEPNFKDDFRISEPPDDPFIKESMEAFRMEHGTVFMPFQECSLYCMSCNTNYRFRAEMAATNYANAFSSTTLSRVGSSSMPSGTSDARSALLKLFKESTYRCFCHYMLGKFLRHPQFLADSKEPKRMLFCLYVHLLHSARSLIREAADLKGCNCEDIKRKEIFELFWLTHRSKLEGEHGAS